MDDDAPPTDADAWRRPGGAVPVTGPPAGAPPGPAEGMPGPTTNDGDSLDDAEAGGPVPEAPEPDGRDPHDQDRPGIEAQAPHDQERPELEERPPHDRQRPDIEAAAVVDHRRPELEERAQRDHRSPEIGEGPHDRQGPDVGRPAQHGLRGGQRVHGWPEHHAPPGGRHVEARGVHGWPRGDGRHPEPASPVVPVVPVGTGGGDAGPPGPLPIGAAAQPEDTDTDHEKSATRNTLEWVAILVGALAVALLVKTFLIQAFFIPSGSMLPTLREGDRVLVNKLSYDVHDVNRGDLVVFRRPPGEQVTQVKDLVKRVVALPGETVEGRDGRVYIDGNPLSEPYLADGQSTVEFAARRIPAGHIWVMGDNRDDSRDSRAFGPIPEDLIVGRAFVRVWPLGDLTLL